MRDRLHSLSRVLLGLWVLSLVPGMPQALAADEKGSRSKQTTKQIPGGRSRVEIIQRANGEHVLLRNGEPYFIRGAGGWEFLDELVAAGGNSIRTWGAEHIDPAAFDEAQRRNLTVMAGLWLPHPREGFDYADAKQVSQLVTRLRAYVRRHKDHPALLLWGIGNEMELDGKDPNIWKTVEAVAAMVHEEDPHHPTVTVLAEVSEQKIVALREHCPSIDALGVNSYGALFSLPQRLQQLGWDKAYVLTEFGPPGPWGEVPVTAWKAPIEPSSTEKADYYLRGYQQAVASQRGRSLGSYVYFWGIEPTIVVTHTWYETFLPGGGKERLGAVEAMQLAWTGKSPVNRAPQLIALRSSAAQQTVAPGSSQTAEVQVQDPDGDSLRVRWEVRAESTTLTGPAPAVITDCIDRSEGLRVSFTAPRTPDPYRLFVYVYDDHGNAATANVPFLVAR
jgi:hypothetical protein